MDQDSASLTPAPAGKIERFQIGLNVLIQLLVVAGIVLMVNYLSFRHFKRWDYSRNQKYALSPQTRRLLANLSKPVRAVLFFSNAADIDADVKALLREYEFASNKKFVAEIVDPYRSFTRASELQAKYKFGASENIVILDYDGRSKFVSAPEMAEYEQPDQVAMMMGQTQQKLKAFKGEQALTSALLDLTEGKPNKIYVLAGHGEPELKSDELKLFGESLQRQNIQAAPLNLLNLNSIPEDARGLLLCGPKYDLSELEIQFLKEFWEKHKGRIFVALDPYAKTPRLNAWLQEQGLAPQGDRVLRSGKFLGVDPATGSPQLKDGTVHEAVFTIDDSKTAITKDLAGASNKLFGVTQSLFLDKSRETIAKVKLLPVLESAQGFWGETDPVESEEHPATFDPTRDHVGPLVLAAGVEKGGVADARVKVDTSRLFVVGNSELITNNGFRLSEGLTMDLALNALNWLLDREELAGIPPKEKQSIALSLNEKQTKNLALAVMVVIPGIVALLGLLNWSQRRT